MATSDPVKGLHSEFLRRWSHPLSGFAELPRLCGPRFKERYPEEINDFRVMAESHLLQELEDAPHQIRIAICIDSRVKKDSSRKLNTMYGSESPGMSQAS